MAVWRGLTNSCEKKRSEKQRRRGKLFPFECRVPKDSRERDKKAFLRDQCKEIEENNRMGKTRDLFRKIRDTKGTFHRKMGSIKDRNGMDLTEAEDINKRWQEYTEELYKKGLHNPDNHNGVTTHLEPDILECEVKWALENITTNKVEVMEFQLSYFKSWKMMLWKCCTQYASKFGKLSSGHRTGKGQFSSQSQRKAMAKNAQTTAQLHSSHTLSKVMLKCKVSVQFSRSVMSSSLQPHGLQHARLPCPSPTSDTCSNPCPSSCWCHPTISSSVVPFSSCPPSFSASECFQMSRLFASGSQSIGVSAPVSVLAVNIQGWFPLRLTGWISLQCKGLWRVFSNTTVQKHQFFSA